MRGSRQFGQSVVWGTRKASCARRLPVRALECRRFGFGIITPFLDHHKKTQKAQRNHFVLLCLFVSYIKFLRAAQRGSVSFVSQLQLPVFLSVPHSGQIPLQSSRQSMRVGTASKTCSFTISSTSIACPSNTETDISASVSSATPLDSYSEPVMYSRAKSALTGVSTGCKQRSHSTCARVSTCPLTKTSLPASRTLPLTVAGSVKLTRSSTGLRSSG